MKRFFIILLLSTCVIVLGQDRNIENQLRLAKSFEESNNFEEAEKIYTDLHFKNPSNFEIYRNLNTLFIKLKKYQESLKLIENQLKLGQSTIDLFGDMGSTYYLQNDEKSAFEAWEKGIRAEPGNPFAYRIIANYLIENRLIEKSIEILNRGNLKSDDPTMFSYDIANLYSMTSKFQEATEEYCKIIEQKPKQTNIVENRIRSYINFNGAYEPTIEVIKNYYKKTENVEYLQMLVNMYLQVNDCTNGLEAAIQVEKSSADNGSFIYNFALRASRLGDHSVAARAFQYIINQYPKSILLAQAEIGYTREMENNLKSTFTISEDWKKYSINSYNSTEFKKLLGAYQNLVKKYPNESVGKEAEYRTAIIYQEFIENNVKADSIYKKIVNQFGVNEFISKANFGLAKISLSNGELVEAEKYLNNVLSNKLTNKELLNESKFILAKIKMWEGKLDDAIIKLNEVKNIPEDENANDAIQWLLIINTFKKDSVNLFSYINADYLIEKKKFNEAALEFKKLAENKALFVLKDFAAVNYIELLLSLNNYSEAVIFLEEISNCDEDNIYKDRFLYLLGASYYYGLQNAPKATLVLSRIFEEFPNSIYSSKARKVIYEINSGEKVKI